MEELKEGMRIKPGEEVAIIYEFEGKFFLALEFGKMPEFLGRKVMEKKGFGVINILNKKMEEMNRELSTKERETEDTEKQKFVKTVERSKRRVEGRRAGKRISRLAKEPGLLNYLYR